jgi:hypothetical protein
MDFNSITLFGKKTFADLLKEIHTNSSSKEKEIRGLIEGLKPFINSAGDAVIIVPLIKEYLEIGVKNDEQLIKMATIIQRAMAVSTASGDSFSISEEEKAALLSEIDKLNKPDSDKK